MGQTKQLIDNVNPYAQRLDKGDLLLPPSKRVTVLACIDARLNPYRLLDLSEDVAHVVRNTGGVVSGDAIRWLAVSQNLLGTEEIVLIRDTDRGMLALADLESEVRDGIERIRASAFIPHTDNVRGFVYEVETGELHEVSRQPSLRR
jgi:carbonic anhydrase